MSDIDRTPEERIDRYLLGQATEADVETLNRLLVEDEQLRKFYRFRVSLEGGYREAAIRGEEEPVVAGSSTTVTVKQPSRSRFHKTLAITLASLAAVVLLSTALWRLKDQEASGDAPSPSSFPVARLVASIDAEWIGVEPISGASLEAGDFRLNSGTVELEFGRGARVTLQGPSRFELKNADLLHVSSGNLVAKISEEAIGFTITTDLTEVVDLGTEFGLSVKDGGQTEVHVLDGLVEVLPRNQTEASAGVMISEGQARSFHLDHDDSPDVIPISSREALVGNGRYRDLGVRTLRGSVRMADRLRAEDYVPNKEGRHWINLIAEQQSVTLKEPLMVTLNTPGRFRKFVGGPTIPKGARVNSYLLHFRPSSRKAVKGVVRFEQPILGVLCIPQQLEESDSILGVSTMDYPKDAAPRGLEPGPYFEAYVAKNGMPSDFQPDEVILSQDRSTLSIRASADPENGYYDQVRILTLAPE